MAIASGYNNYADYKTTQRSGQDEPFLGSRKGALGAIQLITAIPHKIDPENGGSQINSQYGASIALTRIEGVGHHNQFIEMDAATRSQILSEGAVDEITYTAGGSPVEVRVVDPLLVPEGAFTLRLAPDNQHLQSDSARWTIVNDQTGESHTSIHAIQMANEELLIPWGLSITWKQIPADTAETEHFADAIGYRIKFSNTTTPWLAAFEDDDSNSEFNWIRAGQTWVDPEETPLAEYFYNDYNDGNSSSLVASGKYFTDTDEQYESMAAGAWSPYCLVSYSRTEEDGITWMNSIAPTSENLKGDISPIQQKFISNIAGLNNVDIVLTQNPEHWTRCPVFEMQPNNQLSIGGVDKMQLRTSPSVGKNGLPDGTGTGFSWFPGYAIDVSTGERLNMAFGEDSWLVGENGRDMIWNPTSRRTTALGDEVLCGGQHWIYVFKNLQHEIGIDNFMAGYDAGAFVQSKRDSNGIISASDQKRIMAACTWVGSAILNEDFSLLPMDDGLVPCDVEIQLRVAKPYTKFSASNSDLEDYTGADNWWNPMYRFSTTGIAPVIGSESALTSALDCINIVPNPYYAYSEYEQNKLDNRVKITNLPEECTVKIFTVNGVLVREYRKSDPMTSLDWDLKNASGIPIASGVYLVHIDVPGIGEKTLKWFGVMRPVDLDNF
ncbi:MAG: hypothetical protein JNM00_11105 [Flavobacteriales bacterium]|nr:hypothetical protein [Flavobacteriales bacterium]